MEREIKIFDNPKEDLILIQESSGGGTGGIGGIGVTVEGQPQVENEGPEDEQQGTPGSGGGRGKKDQKGSNGGSAQGQGGEPGEDEGGGGGEGEEGDDKGPEGTPGPGSEGSEGEDEGEDQGGKPGGEDEDGEEPGVPGGEGEDEPEDDKPIIDTINIGGQEGEEDEGEGEGGEEDGEGGELMKGGSGAGSGEFREEELPLPYDILPEKLKKELERGYKNLSQMRKAGFRSAAERRLEDLEDKLNEVKEGHLIKDKPKSHAEIEKKERERQEEARRKAEEKRAGEALERELERLRRGGMSRYEQVMEDFGGAKSDLYRRLRKILRPEEFSGEERGHSRGRTLDPRRAMQSEVDFEQTRKMWNRDYEPEKRDYRMMYVVDLSGSMDDYGKAQEAEKGVDITVSATDMLENVDPSTLKIKSGVMGYNNGFQWYKHLSERLNKKVEDNLSVMSRMVGGGTNTAHAIAEALREIENDLGETGNFILNFTDGNAGDAEMLVELLKKRKEERKKKKIKIGLIWVEGNQSEESLKRLVEVYGYDFGLVMPATKLSDSEMEEGKKDFTTALADLLEDIVKNPNKY